MLQQYSNEDRYGITRHLARKLIAKGQIPLPSNTVEVLSAHLADNYTTTCQKNILTCPEVPGASVLLQWLSSRPIPAFINSRTPVEALNRLVALRSFTRYFAGIYGAPASKFENLRQIQKMTRTKPEEMLFVGDSDDDVSAADEFGCHFAGIILRHNSRFKKIPPLHVQNLEELRAVVEKLQEKQNVLSPNH